jgi:hypothetical protein
MKYFYMRHIHYKHPTIGFIVAKLHSICSPECLNLLITRPILTQFIMYLSHLLDMVCMFILLPIFYPIKKIKKYKKIQKRKYKNTRIHLFESLIRYLVFNHHYNFRFWADQVDIFG